MAKNKGLGKGLDALFTETDYSGGTDNTDDSIVQTVRISDIEPDRKQPRKLFKDDALTSLSESIARHGVLQPLVVRRVKSDGNDNAASKLLEGKYSIISGERRWRASKLAGLTEVPVVIKDISDSEAAAVMLVENLQREDLNPVEQAQGLKRLIDEFGLTQEETASIVGISRPALTNSLRLLSLPDEVIDSLANGDISAGHARALLSLGDADDILSALQVVVGKSLSVRETESYVKKVIKLREEGKGAEEEKAGTVKQKERKIYMQKLTEKVSSKLGRKTSISENKKDKTKGKLEIEYYSSEDLEVLLKAICGNDIFKE